jgi:hypothetical protein
MSTTQVANIQSCLSACDAAGTNVCNHAAYSYSATSVGGAAGSAEPAPYTSTIGHAYGSCTMFTGTPTPTGAGQARYAVVVRSTAAAAQPVTVC